MNDLLRPNKPALYSSILEQSEASGFTMPADFQVGLLLKTLAASKPAAHILELGTGTGLSLSWIVDGMDATSRVISIDNDPDLIAIAQPFFANHDQVEIICVDGAAWLQTYAGPAFDLIFADTWPGKYKAFDKTLSLLKTGGFYIIDDMTPQQNWPEGHAKKAQQLIYTLEKREDLILTKMDWSTGIIIAVKKEKN